MSLDIVRILEWRRGNNTHTGGVHDPLADETRDAFFPLLPFSAEVVHIVPETGETDHPTYGHDILRDGRSDLQYR